MLSPIRHGARAASAWRGVGMRKSLVTAFGALMGEGGEWRAFRVWGGEWEPVGGAKIRMRRVWRRSFALGVRGCGRWWRMSRRLGYLSLPPLTPASLSLCMNMSFCFVNRLLTIKSPDFLESGGLMNYGCYCSRHRETRLQKSLRRPQRCSITSMLKRGARKLRVAALVLRCLLLMERLKRVLGKGSGRERVWELARER